MMRRTPASTSVRREVMSPISLRVRRETERKRRPMLLIGSTANGKTANTMRVSIQSSQSMVIRTASTDRVSLTKAIIDVWIACWMAARSFVSRDTR